MEIGETYYIPDFDTDYLYQMSAWNDDDIDHFRQSVGIIRKTKEEAIELARQMLDSKTVIEKQQLRIMKLQQRLSDMGVNE
jgi:hypothetical protein